MPRHINVLISGLPSSGNCLVMNHCKRAGLKCMINHARDDKFFGMVNKFDFMLIPVRLDVKAHWESIARRKIHFPEWDESRWRVVQADIPKHVVLYEELVRTKGKHLDDIIRSFIGVEPSAWPEGPSKTLMPEEGCVLDREACAKYYKNTSVPGARDRGWKQ